MIKVNKTIFNLSDVFTHMNLALTLFTIENFIISRKNLQEGKDFLVERTFEFGEHVEDIISLTEQIEILDTNIKILESALLCHESKALEKRTFLKDLQVICLN